MKGHSNLSLIGGEMPIERSPNTKHCVESRQLLCKSVLWKMLESYYSKMAIEAWSHNYVPSFITSNARLAKTYAKIIFNFLRDWYSSPKADKSRPVHILEIGAGHGRFTFLVVKSLLSYKNIWKEFGLPDRPFIYVYSDVAEANVHFCMNHPALKKLSSKGWVDFALFDGNSKDTTIFLKYAGTNIPIGDPLVVIANYVLDSLLTDAWRLTPGSDAERALVSVYTVDEQPDVTQADIMNQVTVSWDWEPVDINSIDVSLKLLDESNYTPPDYLKRDSHIIDVLQKYRAMDKRMSFVLPVGAFSLFQTLSRLSNNNMFWLVGDKGYPTEKEFMNCRDPHIAVHGCISFMVNLHAIRMYFESIGGSSAATEWKDTFQITGLWRCGNDVSTANSWNAFNEDVTAIVPDLLTMWQKVAADSYSSNSGFSLKQFLPLLRFSAHDADTFWNFRELVSAQAVAPFTNLRVEEDLLNDLHRVYKNWYKIRDDEDVAEACAHVCMKLGKCEKAIYFFKKSRKYLPNSSHCGTLVNMASCYKALNECETALDLCEEALGIAPEFIPALNLKETLLLCVNPIGLAFIGCGHWSRYEAIYLLKRDARCRIVALFAFDVKVAEQFKKYHHLDGAEICSGNEGLKYILTNPDIKACVVDVNYNLNVTMLKKVFESDKHVLSRTPLSLKLSDVKPLLDTYLPRSVDLAWHCVDNYLQEDAFKQAAIHIKKVGVPTSFSIYHVTECAQLEQSYSIAPHSPREQLIIELTRSLRAMSTILEKQVKSISAKVSKEVENVNGGEVVCGWASFGNHENSSTVIGSFFVTHKGGDNSINYKAFCSNGMLEINKFTSAWQVVITTDTQPNQPVDMSYQSIGHQKNHDDWMEQIRRKSIVSTMKSSIEGTDKSISEGFIDTAIAEGINSSMEEGGCVAKFGYKATAAV